MGLNTKKILTIGACTIGGIIAAPAVVSVAASTLLVSGGAATLGVAETLLFASTTTVGAVGGATGVVVGTGVNKIVEKEEKKRDNAYRSGFNAASKIYEEKFKKQAEAFLSKEKSFKDNVEEYKALISDMQNCIVELENDLKTTTLDKERKEEEIALLRYKVEQLKSLKDENEQ